MFNNKFVSFTVCNVAYLHKSLALADSHLKYTGQKIHIYIYDGKRDVGDFSDIANIIWLEDLNIPNYYSLAMKYDVTEFTTSLKAYIALQLIENNDKVIFFDPDTYICRSIDSILSTLDNEDIMLTPHYIHPRAKGGDLFSGNDSDIGMMRFGSFNLGFFAVRKSEESIKFLKWFDDRCQDLCFFETQYGLSTDQKWVSIAPCFFPSLYISRDMGLNVAFWNMHERIIGGTLDQGIKVNDEYDLIFFHFSSFNERMPSELTTRPLSVDISNNSSMQMLIDMYNNIHTRYKDIMKSKDKKYTYDYMSDGSYIAPVLRRAYASQLKRFNELNPFDSSGEVYRFAKRNRLLEKANTTYVPKGSNDISSNKKAFKIINFVLRILLRIMGPSKFSNLSRLFVYLSSFRTVKGLWKD